MITVDWNSLIAIIITAIGVGITTFVPLFVKIVMEAIGAKLTLVKQFTERNQAFAIEAVLFVERTMKTAASNEKLQAGIARFNESLNLPEGTIIKLLEDAISTLQFSAAENWAKLGTPKTATTPTPVTVELKVTPVDITPEVPVPDLPALPEVPEVPVETPLENPEI